MKKKEKKSEETILSLVGISTNPTRERKKELVEWVTTLTREILDNKWVGSFTANFAPGGGISNVNVNISLRPGQRIEIKKE